MNWPIGLIAVTVVLAVPALGVEPTDEELTTARNWVADHFKQVGQVEPAATKPAPPEPGLHVITNYGPVQRNQRDGNRLRIADQTFEKGLYCHAHSKILVRLPGPAKSFTAVVGGETNGSFTGGTTQYFVLVGEMELYRSGVIPRGQAGTPVSVDLGGATEFTIKVGDGGDNINSDQACWGDAQVTLADGNDIYLGDLDIVEPALPVRRTGAPPFSFVYGDKLSDELLGDWQFTKRSRKLDETRSETVQTYTDPKTGLQVRCVIVEYSDFPTVEWTLYFRNTGKQDTPIISDIHSLDTQFASHSGNFRLHHFVGSPCQPNDFQPLEADLGPNSDLRIATTGGRPTNSNLPYFNIETGSNTGVIAVIGWSGQWSSRFLRDESHALRICGGQELTRFRLHPGEEVRSPMSVLQFYQGDWHRAQNVWRAWMVTHNLPQLDGKPIRPIASVCTGNSYPGIITNAMDEMHFLRRYLEEEVVPDFWWQDAGWYPCGEPGNWGMTGTWEVEPSRWPNGIREVSDWLKPHGIRTIVWFEPERVGGPGTWLYDHHKDDWLLGGTLLDLGNPEARRWLTDHISNLLIEQGIDLYRQDFNIDPLGFWRANDADDRQGITEIKHVEGYLAFWDELKRRHNDMLIDSCASGGRRNDLETLRRAVPLLRSDYLFEPVGEQCHTYGCSFWWPFNGTGFLTQDIYLIRSQMSPEFTMGVDTRPTDQSYDVLRKAFREWKQVSPCYFGDYWPLTGYSLKNDVWMAWQFDRPDLGEGFFQAFRRAECAEESITLKLRGLDPNATYTVTDLDNPAPMQVQGSELMNGFLAHSAERPAALIWTYKREQSR